jgi:hypothetical protein
MTLIALTGNYCFFNLLTVALCVLLLDDALQRNPAQWDLLNVKAIAFGAWEKWDSAATVMSLAAEADSSKVDSTFITRMLDFAGHAGDSARTLHR